MQDRTRSVLRTLLVPLLAAAIVLTVWTGLLALDKALFFQRTGRTPYHTNAFRLAAKEVVSTILEPYYDYQLVSTTTLPIYDIQLSPRRLEEWNTILRRVTERGRARPEDQYYIPARFRTADRGWEVKIRTRGTIADHYKVAKPSFRVKFPSADYFRGTRIINLIIPYDKPATEMFNGIAAEYDILTYPTRYAVVRLNDRVLGVYQEIEHFRKELAVKQGRSEGLFFSGKGEAKGRGKNAGALPEGVRSALDALAGCAKPCDPRQARDLLDTYLDGEKMAAFTALTTLFGSSHAWGPDDLILFLDPARGRFEPVPWDVGIRSLAKVPDLEPREFETVAGLGENLLRDPDFRRRRNQILWELVERGVDSIVEYDRRLLDGLRPSLDYDTEHSRAYTDRKAREREAALVGNARRIRAELVANDLQVTLASDGLLFANRAAGSVYVDAVRAEADSGRSESIQIGLEIPGRFRDVPGHAFFALEMPFVATRVEVVARNRLSASALVRENIAWEAKRGPLPLPRDPVAVAALSVPPGVVVEQGDRGPVWVFSGEIQLKESLALPEGASASFRPGLLLELGPEVDLVVRGDLHSVGTPEAPIRVAPLDPTRPFGSLALLGRSHRGVSARIEHTEVAGGSEADFFGVHFSGAFSIYDGSLVMKHARVVDAAGEDGLNVKYGRVDIRESLFSGSAGDAVDLDFCTGTVRDNQVLDSTGDGLDFSGSTLEVEGNLITDSGDKGMSVGEASSVSLLGNTIRRAVTGIAVKDRSVATLVDNTLSDLDVGVAIYQKKPVFGSATVHYRSGSIEGAQTDFLTDPKAELIGLVARSGTGSG